MKTTQKIIVKLTILLLSISTINCTESCVYPTNNILWDLPNDATNWNSTLYLPDGVTKDESYQPYADGIVTREALEVELYSAWDFGPGALAYPITITAWVKHTEDTIDYVSIFDHSNAFEADSYFYVFILNTKLGTQFVLPSGDICRHVWEDVFVRDTWVHITIVYRAGNNIRGYKNGVHLTAQSVDPSCTNTADLPAGSKNYNRIGMDYKSEQRFIGFIDDFKVYTVALSDAEVACVALGDQDQCYHPCAFCQAGSSNCSVCKEQTTNFRVVPAPIGDCACEDGYYDDGSQDCQECVAPCVNCEGGSTTCLTCDKVNMLPPHCSCQPGEFEYLPVDGEEDIDEACQDCPYHCETCTNTLKCDTCNTAMFRELEVTGTAPDDLRVCICSDRYYDVGGDTELCGLCLYRCATCANGEALCTACRGNNRDMTDIPNCGCEYGFYDDNQDNQHCQQCYNKCADCVENPFNCTVCNGDNRENDPDQGCPCLEGYYEFFATRTTPEANANCRICDAKCRTCYYNRQLQTMAQNCLECQGDNRSRIVPDCECLEHYFDTGAADCSECNYYCDTCVTTAGNCTRCHGEPTRENANGSNCGCLDYHYDVGVLQCAECHSSCRRCNGPNDNQCTACATGSNRTPQGGYCRCAPGYWEDFDGICQLCRHNCGNCSDAATCDTCPGNVHLRINDPANLCPCRDNYYDDGVNKSCAPCHVLCVTCTGGGTRHYCKQCAEGELINTRSYGQDIIGSCNLICDDGDYNNGDVCSPCHDSCQTCDGPNATDCLSCDEVNAEAWNRYSVVNQQGECACLPGYFEFNTNICKQCDSQCQTCTLQSDNCSSCSGLNKSLPHCNCIVDYELNINGDCQKKQAKSSSILKFIQILVITLAFLII